EQRWGDGHHAFERVANGARLLEYFLLHVVAVGAQFHRAAVHGDVAHGALFVDDALIARTVWQGALAPLAGRVEGHDVACCAMASDARKRSVASTPPTPKIKGEP